MIMALPLPPSYNLNDIPYLPPTTIPNLLRAPTNANDHIKTLTRHFIGFVLHPLPAEPAHDVPQSTKAQIEEWLGAELEHLRRLLEQLEEHQATIQITRAWMAHPNLVSSLFVALLNLKVLVQRNIFTVQRRLHNFEPVIMNALGFDLTRLVQP